MELEEYLQLSGKGGIIRSHKPFQSSILRWQRRPQETPVRITKPRHVPVPDKVRALLLGQHAQGISCSLSFSYWLTSACSGTPATICQAPRFDIHVRHPECDLAITLHNILHPIFSVDSFLLSPHYVECQSEKQLQLHMCHTPEVRQWWTLQEKLLEHNIHTWQIGWTRVQ